MTTTIEILTAARELLTDPSHWTKGANARNVRGKEALPNYPSAVCWCMTGAPTTLFRAPWTSVALTSAIVLLQTTISDGIIAFNDRPDTTHTDVLRVLDAAIKKAQS